MTTDDREKLLAFLREQAQQKDNKSKLDPFWGVANEEMPPEMQQRILQQYMNESFIPKSEDDYRQMLFEAKKVFSDPAIPLNVRVHYKKFIDQADEEIKRNNGHVDVSKAKVRKSYLGLKKFVKYKAKAQTSTEAGYFDENSPLLGVDADTYKKLEKVYQNIDEYQFFEKELYEKNRAYYYMIPAEDKVAAEKIGNEMLETELNKYGVKKEDVFSSEMTNFQSATYCHSVDNEWNNWKLQVILDKNQLDEEGKGEYCPLGVVALHELGHVKQTMPGISEAEFSEKKGPELAPTIDLIVRQDEIYKRIHHIDLAEEVEYPQKLVLGGQEVKLGALANKFRQIKEQYGYDSYENVLLTKEAQSYICSLEKNINMTKREVRRGKSIVEK